MSKPVDFQNPKGTIADKVFIIMHRYKPFYKIFKTPFSMKLISFEAKAKISQFKMEIMALGLPKQVAEGLHARMML